jgi:hypothetical protein
MQDSSGIRLGLEMLDGSCDGEELTFYIKTIEGFGIWRRGGWRG